MKRCYACSKFILLNRLLYGDQGGNVEGESASMYPNKYLKYPDAKAKTCQGSMYSPSKKNSLQEAEGKCGGSIYNLLVGDKGKMENAGDSSKTSLFIQLANKMNNPVADLLSGSSGSGKEGQAKKEEE